MRGYFATRSGYTRMQPRDVMFTIREGSHSREHTQRGGGLLTYRGVCGSLRVLSTVRQARVLAVYFATRFTTITVN